MSKSFAKNGACVEQGSASKVINFVQLKKDDNHNMLCKNKQGTADYLM